MPNYIRNSFLSKTVFNDENNDLQDIFENGEPFVDEWLADDKEEEGLWKDYKEKHDDWDRD